MSDYPENQRAAPRDQEEIFNDLRSIAKSDGFLHVISQIVYRDTIITVDMREGKVADSPESRWSIDKLNKNEIMLLLGLMVQADSERVYSVLPEISLESVDTLLREFHDALMVNHATLLTTEGEFRDSPSSLSDLAREAIYYGADSFYLRQFEHFSKERYRDDTEWLLSEVGISIRSILEIARAITDQVNRQISAVRHILEQSEKDQIEIKSNSLLVSKSELRKQYGDKVDLFCSRFSTAAFGSNEDFNGPFSINRVSLAPLIDLEEFLYLPNQQRLFESIYESPFYWMIADVSPANSSRIG